MPCGDPNKPKPNQVVQIASRTTVAERPKKPRVEKPRVKLVTHHCDICGYVGMHQKHTCKPVSAISWQADRAAMCSRCPYNDKEQDICTLYKSQHPDRDCIVTIGITLPFAACPAGFWPKVEMTCEKCGSVTFNERGVVQCASCRWNPNRKCSLPPIVKLQDEPPLEAKSPLVVITIAAGQKAIELLEYTGPQMRAYAERCGADFHVIMDNQCDWYPIGNKFRLATITSNYERILFIDSDVWIRDEAPDLFHLHDSGKVWIHYDKPLLGSTDWVKGESELSAKQQNVEPIDLQVLNTGVVLFDNAHRDIWTAPKTPTPPRHLLEQTHVEYQIHRKGYEVGHIDTKFNTQWWFPDFAEREPDAYFVHLANCPHNERIYRFRKLAYERNVRGEIPIGQTIDIARYHSETAPGADEVLFITTHFNPARWTRQSETYYEWLSALGPLGNHVKCYELVLDDDTQEIEGSHVIRGTREKHAMWQKEALINRAIEDHGDQFKYVAWLDHDFVFGDPKWLTRALDKLKRGTTAVQLFSRLKYLRVDRVVTHSIAGAVASWQQPPPGGYNPGGAWMADMAYIRKIGGLYDRCLVGDGDNMLFDHFAGRFGDHFKLKTPRIQSDMKRWMSGTWMRTRGKRSMDHLNMTVYHLYHGEVANRQYGKRDMILCEHDFDPRIDVINNADGILEWATDKPAFHEAVRQYFHARREDE